MMNTSTLKEVWYCSHCGHEVRENDEFCFACESLFTGTALAERSHFRERVAAPQGEMKSLVHVAAMNEPQRALFG